MEENKQRLIDEVTARLNAMHEGCTVEVRDVTKNNGITLTGLVLRTAGSTVAATIYINEFLKEIKAGRMDLLTAAELIVDALAKSKLEDSVMQAVEEFKHNPLKERITVQVISHTKNEEMLANMPHQRVGEDLALIARYKVCEGGTITIDNNLAAKMGMTPSEIIEAGIQNRKKEPYDIINMRDMLRQLMGDKLFTQEFGEEMSYVMGKIAPMLVVTNPSRVHGATGVFINPELRQKIYDRFGGEYYLIPASIHETIAIDAKSFDLSETNRMIQEVNQTNVPEEEVLSDHLYHVDSSLRITPVFDEKEAEKSTEKAVVKATTGQHM